MNSTTIEDFFDNLTKNTPTYLYFRVTGDTCHIIAMLMLILWIKIRRSCSEISGRTQVLLALVYLTRYLDLVTIYVSFYNSMLKAGFIGFSWITVYLIYVQFKKTYDLDNDSFMMEFLIVPSLVLGVLVNHRFTFIEILWTFSIYLEAVAMVPQFYMILKTRKCPRFMAFYLTLMCLYRGLYIINWYFRYQSQYFMDPITIFGGTIQTGLYLVFFVIFLLRIKKDSKAPLIDEEQKKPIEIVSLEVGKDSEIPYIDKEEETAVEN